MLSSPPPRLLLLVEAAGGRLRRGGSEEIGGAGAGAGAAAVVADHQHVFIIARGIRGIRIRADHSHSLGPMMISSSSHPRIPPLVVLRVCHELSFHHLPAAAAAAADHHHGQETGPGCCSWHRLLATALGLRFCGFGFGVFFFLLLSVSCFSLDLDFSILLKKV
jgi:hypothetical protein